MTIYPARHELADVMASNPEGVTVPQIVQTWAGRYSKAELADVTSWARYQLNRMKKRGEAQSDAGQYSNSVKVWRLVQ